LRYGLRRALGFSRTSVPCFHSFQPLHSFRSYSILTSRCFATKSSALEKPQQTGIIGAKKRLAETVDGMIEAVESEHHGAELEKAVKAAEGRISLVTEDNIKTFVLKLSKEKYDVEVKWNPDDSTADPTVEDQGVDEEEKDQSQPDNEIKQGPPAHNLLVHITPHGKSQRLRVACIATSDYDLRVDGIDLSDEKGEFPEDKIEELGALDFNELDADVQDGVYDLLHALNIDDRTATIVHHQNHLYKNKSLAHSLKKFIEFTNL